MSWVSENHLPCVVAGEHFLDTRIARNRPDCIYITLQPRIVSGRAGSLAGFQLRGSWDWSLNLPRERLLRRAFVLSCPARAITKPKPKHKQRKEKCQKEGAKSKQAPLQGNKQQFLPPPQKKKNSAYPNEKKEPEPTQKKRDRRRRRRKKTKASSADFHTPTRSCPIFSRQDTQPTHVASSQARIQRRRRRRHRHRRRRRSRSRSLYRYQTAVSQRTPGDDAATSRTGSASMRGAGS